MSSKNQNNILLEYDFQSVSYKSIDMLGRMTQQDVPFRQFCSAKDEPKYFCYFADPFQNLPTLNIFKSSKEHDIAIQVESLLKAKKIELELELSIDFIIFDSAKSPNEQMLAFDSGSNCQYIKYDRNQLSNIRSEIASHLERIGIHVSHHLEIDNLNKCSITLASTNFLSAVNNFLVAKYLIKSVVASYGKIATFMPKPNNLQQNSITTLITLDGIKIRNFALGIAQHIKALTAFTNPSYNGFKKLLLHKEVAKIKIVDFKKHIQKIQLQFIDCISNPLLSFSAIILAGLSYDAKNQTEESLNEIDITLRFADNLTDSLRIIEKELKFYYNIFETSLVNKYTHLIKDNENFHNLHISASEVMIYYNM